jgi:ribosomal-protein-alanine N-acetyltransferase
VRERGGRLVTLEVRMSNARAQALYEKAGFQRVAIREGYYSRPSEDAYVMILALEENPWG